MTVSRGLSTAIHEQRGLPPPASLSVEDSPGGVSPAPSTAGSGHGAAAGDAQDLLAPLFSHLPGDRHGRYLSPGQPPAPAQPDAHSSTRPPRPAGGLRVSWVASQSLSTLLGPPSTKGSPVGWGAPSQV